MSSSISSLGVGSGLDLTSLLDQLSQSEQSRLQPLQKQANSYQTKLSAYGALQSAVENVQTAAESLGKSSLYEGVSVGSGNTAFSASASAGASPGRYSVAVTNLASAQSLVTKVGNGQASTDAQIGTGGTITLSLGDGNGNTSSTVDIDISSDDSSLGGIRDAINAADIGVDASIVNDGSDTPFRLVLSSRATGTDSQITVQATDAADATGTPLADLLNYDGQTGSGAMQQTVPATNATLTVNGIGITSQSNTVEDAIGGVTLNLSAKTPVDAPETLTATRNTGAVKNSIKAFVSAYNSMHSVSDQLTAYNGEDDASGVLLGDSTARSAQSRIRSALNTPVDEGAYTNLAQIGVSLQRDGTMKIDDTKLDDALANNLSDVAALMTGGDETKGVSAILTDTLKNVAGENSLLQAASDGVQRSIDSTAKRMDRMQESIDSTIARYKEQFVQLDSLLSSINSTKSYLTQQFASLNNSSNS